jgi:hypothetical protein
MPPMDPAATPPPEKADDEPKAEEGQKAEDGPLIAITGLADEGGPERGGDANAEASAAELGGGGAGLG